MSATYDAIVVGARCGGATLALELARAGMRVVAIERDLQGTDTVSTHVIFPNTLDRLDRLGVLERLQTRHDLPWLRWSWRFGPHDVAGTFTPVGGYDRASCIRRIVLDATLARAAQDAGAEIRYGTGVRRLVGLGTVDDPVRGVVLDDGTELAAPWVFGADGRASTVARHVGAARRDESRGEQAFLFAYWGGLPPTDWFRMDIHEGRALMSTPCEDGIHLLVLLGDTTFVRGTAADRRTRYHTGLRRYPATLNPRLLDRAQQVSGVIAVPETMMRGFYRQAAGDGWALVGDAGHFKHPSTAQGIADAIDQAQYVASAVTGTGPGLDGYEAWRDQRAEGFSEWSFQLGRLPAGHRTGPLFAGLAADPVAAQQWRDAFCRRATPAEVHTFGRMTRWRAAWAYADAQGRLVELARSLSAAQLATSVPACPGWTVRDVLAHLDGIAADAIAGRVPEGLDDAWQDGGAAAARDAWTDHQVASRRDLPVEALLTGWDRHTRDLVQRLRRGDGFSDDDPVGVTMPAVDLAVHIQDVRGALGCPGDRTTSATQLAFGVYIAWLDQRLRAAGLPALQLSDGRRTWSAGDGTPDTTVTGDAFELFRVLSGRRSAEQIASLGWEGDPMPYLVTLSPYPLPVVALSEPSTPTPPGLCASSTAEQ
jgi:uncharacterized protein (TIGR03083 family)